jgi:hypothetical protein
MAIAVGSYFLVLVVQLDTAPTALTNIGWRYVITDLPPFLTFVKIEKLTQSLLYYRLLLIYLCLLVVFIPFIWLICPETKGKSLEEVGVVFGDRHVRVTLDGQQASADDQKVFGEEVERGVHETHDKM